MFYVYTYKDKFVTINKSNLKRGLTRNIEKASYWNSKSIAIPWGSMIRAKYPTAELKEAKLTLK